MLTNSHTLFCLLFAIIISVKTFAIPTDEKFETKQFSYFDKTVKDQSVLLSAIASLNNVSTSTDFHLFTHGKPGHLYIHNEWLDAQGIVDFLISTKSFTNKEKLFIYACNFAKDEIGQQAVNYIITKLNVSVAASDDLTGIDGDWDLEVGNHEGILNPIDYPFNLQTPLAFGNPSLILDVPSTDIGDQHRYSNVVPDIDAIVTITGTNITNEANVGLVFEGTDDLRSRLAETPGSEEIAWMTYNIRLVDVGTTTTISTPISHAEVLFSDLDGIVDRPGLSDFAGIPSSDYTTASLDITSKLVLRNDIVSGYDVAIFDDGEFGMVNEGESNSLQSLYTVQYDLHNFTSFDVVNGYLTFDTETEEIGGFDYSRHVEMDMNADYELVSPVSAILPVELLRFEAKKNHVNVELEWATAQELNNSHFYVEYSLDGIDFISFTQVLGQGTTSELSMYQTTHRKAQELANPVIYYRLKQVDHDGMFEYSEIVSVRFKNEKTGSISIYPNPVAVTNNIFLSFSDEKPTGNYIISLYNSVGLNVVDYLYNGSGSIAIPDELQAGHYTLIVYDTSQDHYFRKKLIILNE